MTIIGLLMLFAPLGALPRDLAFVEQAKRCGIKSDQMSWTVDAQGQRHVGITRKGNLDTLPLESLKCMADWAQRTGTRIGFISEPPPKR